MIDIDTIKVGDKVYYQPDYYKKDGKFENGIVKSIPSCRVAVRVVYHCNDDWDNYMDYTAALTDVKDLYIGWNSPLGELEQ